MTTQSHPTPEIWDETAVSVGMEMARKMFVGRTGHGGNGHIVERHISETKLAAFAALVYERARADAEMRNGATHDALVAAVDAVIAQARAALAAAEKELSQ